MAYKIRGRQLKQQGVAVRADPRCLEARNNNYQEETI